MHLDLDFERRHTVVATVPDAGGMNKNMVDTTLVAADAALAVWLEMWNTDSETARRICSDDFRIHFLISETDGSNPGDDVLMEMIQEADEDRDGEVSFEEFKNVMLQMKGK